MSLAIDQISTENGRLQQIRPHISPDHRPNLPDTDLSPSPRPNPWHVNVAPIERALSCVVGGALVGLAASKPSSLRLLGALGGTALLARGLSGHCMGYSLLGTSTANRPAAAPQDFPGRAIHLEASVTIMKPAAELYAYWRNFSQLPRFMEGLDRVIVHDDRRSRWVAKAPAGTVVEWEAEIVADEPDRLIAWKSLANADVDNAGSVRFAPAPGDRGTEVKVIIDYLPPGGFLGNIIAKLFGRSPNTQVHEDLRRFKQLMEAGELPTTLGQPRGTRC